MPRRNYSCYDYQKSERENLEKIYEKSFSDNFIGEDDQYGKEFKNGSKITVKIDSINNDVAVCESSMGQSIVINLKKEFKSIRNLGYPEVELREGDILDVIVIKDKSGLYNGSLSAGYEATIKDGIYEAMKNEDSAFTVEIESLCNGGFMVNLSGIKCFLPGSLAAANRIMDFSSYLGKKINVMIETYDQKRDIFVVSFKKYLKRIISSKVQELSLTQKYTGKITGHVENLGTFVEWDEIFTGLIPIDQTAGTQIEKMSSGSSVDFWVSDIKNPSRIGLTIKEPSEKNTILQGMKDFSMESGENKIYKGKVSKVKTFGVFVKLDNGFNGLIEREKLSNPINEYSPGLEVSCSVLSVDSATLKINLMET